MDSRGTVNVISSLFRENNKHGIYVETTSGLIGLEKVNASKNHYSGMLIDTGSILLSVSDSNFDNNNRSGLRITNQLNTTINISDTQFKGNTGNRSHGLYLVDFKGDCNVELSKLNIVGNTGSNGASFERISLANLIITSSKFDRTVGMDYQLLVFRVIKVPFETFPRRGMLRVALTCLAEILTCH